MSAALKTGGDAKALRNTKFPEEFNVKVDMGKVNGNVMQTWVKNQLAKLLNSDDDVVPGMVNEALKEKNPNIKKLQLDISGFLDKDTPAFCLELWKLLLSAQATSNGIPPQLLEAKKNELMMEQRQDEEARAQANRQQQAQRERDRELANIRDRERGNRGRGRGGGGNYDRRPPPRDSRSPPPRRRYGDDFRRSAPLRNTDSYVPSSRGRRDDHSPPRYRRARSPSSARSLSRSRSRSPRAKQSRGAARKSSYRDRSSPAAARRRSYSRSDEDNDADNRSPPPKRRRRPSPSRSRSPPGGYKRSYGRRRGPRSSPRRPGSSNLTDIDLMSRADRGRDARRLKRPRSSEVTSSRSRSPRRSKSPMDVNGREPEEIAQAAPAGAQVGNGL